MANDGSVDVSAKHLQIGECEYEMDTFWNKEGAVALSGTAVE